MEDFTNIADRIRQIVDNKEITVNKFSNSVGVSNSYFNKLFKNKGAIGSDKIEKILRAYPDISPKWLVVGEGKMLKKEEEKTLFVKKEGVSTKNTDIPYFELNTEAGMPSPFGGVAIEAIQNPTEFYNLSHEFGNDNVFITNVWGDSMSPKYESGDRIICKLIRELSFVQWGRTYLLDTEQGILVKNIEPYEKDEVFYLCVSENKQYKPFRLHKEEIRNVALIIGVVRREG